MAVITPDSFDPLLRYVGVRLQQGVPLVDADANEGEDIRKFELRAYLKWFVGDGVPYGNDGFRIVGTGAVNDLTIASGLTGAVPAVGNYRVGLVHVGRCVVDGLDVLIEADAGFRAQSLHVSQPTAAARAVAWAVPTVPELPSTNGTVLVYIDVWERLVTPTEAPGLIFAGIGTESCARMRREWVVRWRSASTVPVAGDPDHIPGHGYCALAQVTRRTSSGAVISTDVTDLRNRQLLMPPATIIEDLLGTTADRYRAGLDRPPISLRSAINALLRGEVPSGADFPIAPAPSATDEMSHSFLADAFGGHNAFWHSNRVGGVNQVFATRWTAGSVSEAAAAPVQVTSGATTHSVPHAVQLPTGDWLVAYETNATDIHFRRASSLAGLATATETSLATTAATERQPFIVQSGSQLVFFWHRATPSPRWVYQRRSYDATWSEGTATFLDAAPVDLAGLDAASPGSTRGQFHAAVDATGTVWVAFRTLANNIFVARLTPSTGTVVLLPVPFAAGFDSLGTDQRPSVVVDGTAGVFVFWEGTAGLFSQHFTTATAVWDAAVTAIPDTNVGTSNVLASAARDAEGAIWLFWSSDRGAVGNRDIWFVRRSPLTGSWGSARQVVTASGGDDSPFALPVSGGVIWLFWRSNRAGTTLANYDLYAKQLITAV